MNNINDIARQHSKSAAVVFRKRGLNIPPTANNILLQTILHKEDFINDLANQVELDLLSMSSFEGDIPMGVQNMVATLPPKVFANAKVLPNVTIEKAKAKSSKLKNTLTDVLGILAGSLGTYQAAKNKGENTTAPDLTKPLEDKAKQEKQKKTLLIIGIAIIVVLAILLATNKNK